LTLGSGSVFWIRIRIQLPKGIRILSGCGSGFLFYTVGQPAPPSADHTEKDCILVTYQFHWSIYACTFPTRGTVHTHYSYVAHFHSSGSYQSHSYTILEVAFAFYDYGKSFFTYSILNFPGTAHTIVLKILQGWCRCSIRPAWTLSSSLTCWRRPASGSSTSAKRTNFARESSRKKWGWRAAGTATFHSGIKI
jgi:hypothetical protein